jgi:hypothetical protein
MVKLLEHRIIYRETRFHAAFPSIVRLSDDSLLLAFRRARDGMWLLDNEKRKVANPLEVIDHIDPRSHIVLQRLAPSGMRSLGEADILPVDPESGDQDASLLLLPGDDVLLASFSWYPLPASVSSLLASREAPGEKAKGCRYIYWGSHTSRRSGKSGNWTFHHNYLQPDGDFGQVISPDGSKTVVGATRGQALYRDDEILLPVYGGPAEGCALFASKDGGASWHYRSLIARDDTIALQEPALCEDGQGGIVCFMRTAGAEGRLATSHSKDGISWSPMKLHQLVGHPFHPLVLSDGRVLLSYGYRDKPYGIRARLLAHARQDPDDANEIIIRDDGLCPDLGYPWAVELENKKIMVSYYWTDEQGTRHIAASWLEQGE